MHVLITADAVGGVWTYSRELVTGLIKQNVRVTLVSLGAIPPASETAWMESLPGLDYRPTAFRLEWMQDSEADVEQSSHYLESVIRDVQPDVLHLNQYCYGCLPVPVPRIVVAHSDVVSWWVAVRGREPENAWSDWYRETILRGLRGADAVVAPSEWMLAQIRRYYGTSVRERVIHNGCAPEQFDAQHAKENCILAVGRVWDEAKGISLLLEREHSAPLWIVGPEEEPGADSRKRLAPAKRVALLGRQRRQRVCSLFARAGTYAAPCLYEPFGLAALEAAFSRCALVVSDIASFEEIWGDAAVYFRTNNSGDLVRAIGEMTAKRALRLKAADRVYERAHERYTASRMVTEYQQLYQEVTAGVRA